MCHIRIKSIILLLTFAIMSTWWNSLPGMIPTGSMLSLAHLTGKIQKVPLINTSPKK